MVLAGPPSRPGCGDRPASDQIAMPIQLSQYGHRARSPACCKTVHSVLKSTDPAIWQSYAACGAYVLRKVGGPCGEAQSANGAAGFKAAGLGAGRPALLHTSRTEKKRSAKLRGTGAPRFCQLGCGVGLASRTTIAAAIYSAPDCSQSPAPHLHRELRSRLRRKK